MLTLSLAAAFLWLPGAPASAAASRAAPPPRCDGHVATIVGTAGFDHLVGTEGPDVIVGLGGADRIEGRGGDDIICGGANAGRGDRQLQGDDIDGGPGSDYIDPGADRRRVGFEGVPDILRYSHATLGVHIDLSSSTGTVTEGADTDTVRVAEGMMVLGSQYDDVIVGTRFDDALDGNKGADVLEGGRGDDGIDEDDGMFSRSDRVPDQELGGPGRDSLQASGGGDVLDGGAGGDFLYESYADAASMSGGAGDDDLWASFDGHAGRALDGGAGIDLVELDNVDPYDPAGAQLIADAGAGNVHSSVATQTPLPVSGVERWHLMAEQDVVFLGSAGPDWVDARGAEHLSAQTFGGDDVVRGSDGRDTIDTGDGTDRIDGRLGRDSCVGGEEVRRCETSP